VHWLVMLQGRPLMPREVFEWAAEVTVSAPAPFNAGSPAELMKTSAQVAGSQGID
jgi:hypothetical protein